MGIGDILKTQLPDSSPGEDHGQVCRRRLGGQPARAGEAWPRA